MKLKESIQSNSFKIIDLYNKIEAGLLITDPTFQRKLVWKKQHKYAFVQTILWNYPFPEVYIASAEVDVDKLKALEIVVDGQQRLTTIVDYIKGRGDFSSQKKIPSFDSLEIQDKKDFLNYPVTVKDLKSIGMEKIKEIFKRINSTDYSLNTNEIINAQYGDGEFSIFCKQLADSKYEATEEITDIVIDQDIRSFVNNFFMKNGLFSENDIKRMFDTQYLMLIASTLLEGDYFGRNSKINTYLERYNAEFDNYKDVLGQIVNSLEIVDKMQFSPGSYWFNKPNLFNLIVEFRDLDQKKINFDVLERALLDLEEKVDIYFNGDEDQIKLLSGEETKFFEVSRQGSHELAARQHRAKVIKEIVAKSTQDVAIHIEQEAIAGEDKDFAIIIPTATGLSKSIMDATLPVREFLKRNQIHDYDTQASGPQEKKKMTGYFVMPNGEKTPTEVSLYRSNGRGDCRIWFTHLPGFAKADQPLKLTFENNELHIYNTMTP